MRRDYGDFRYFSCRFEIAAMFLVLVSWMYSFIVYYNVEPLSLWWNVYMLLLAVALYFVLSTRRAVKGCVGP